MGVVDLRIDDIIQKGYSDINDFLEGKDRSRGYELFKMLEGYSDPELTKKMFQYIYTHTEGYDKKATDEFASTSFDVMARIYFVASRTRDMDQLLKEMKPETSLSELAMTEQEMIDVHDILDPQIKPPLQGWLEQKTIAECIEYVFTNQPIAQSQKSTYAQK